MGYCILILSTMAMSCYEMGLMTDEVVFSLVICSNSMQCVGSEENRKYIIFFYIWFSGLRLKRSSKSLRSAGNDYSNNNNN